MRRKKGYTLDYIQIVLAVCMIIGTVFLVLDWRSYELCFPLFFFLTALESFLSGVKTAADEDRKNKFAIAAAFFLLTAFMLGLFICCILIMRSGS